MKFFKKNKFINELIARREEVINRARSVANRLLPDYLLERRMEDILFWIVEPHLTPKYINHRPTPNITERGLHQTVYKIMEVAEKIEQDKSEATE